MLWLYCYVLHLNWLYVLVGSGLLTVFVTAALVMAARLGTADCGVPHNGKLMRYLASSVSTIPHLSVSKLFSHLPQMRHLVHK